MFPKVFQYGVIHRFQLLSVVKEVPVFTCLQGVTERIYLNIGC